ncbi:MAG: aminotransferase class I/II-fold pyridoxal phosphate-dependent enzyme, partial [Polyangiales bacterium]
MSSLPLPPYIAALPAYKPGFNAAELGDASSAAGAPYIKLASNENPYGTAPAVAEAIAVLGGQLARYPSLQAEPLCARLAAFYGLRPAQVCVTAGSNVLIELVVRAFVAPGEAGIVAVPSFPCYALALQQHGRS